MKRYSFQIAAGIAAAGLGSLGVYQFIPGNSEGLASNWPPVEDVAAEEPPAPLALTSPNSDIPPSTNDFSATGFESGDTVVRANNESAAPSWYDSETPLPTATNVNYEASMAPTPIAPPSGLETPTFTGNSSGSSDPLGPSEPAGTSLVIPTLPPTSAGLEAPASAGLEGPTSAGLEGPTYLGDSTAVTAENSAPAAGYGLPSFSEPTIPAVPDAPLPNTLSAPAASPQAYPTGQEFPENTPPAAANLSSANSAPTDLGPIAAPPTNMTGTNQMAPMTAYTAADEVASELTLRPVADSPSNVQAPQLGSSQPGFEPYAESTLESGSGVSLGNASPQSLPSDSLSARSLSADEASLGSNASPEPLTPLVPIDGTTNSAPQVGEIQAQPSRRMSSNTAPSASPTTNSLMSLSTNTVAQTSQAQYSTGLGVLPTQTVDAAEILSQPGTRNLEGPQAPSVVVHKRAPAEVRVGKPCEFVISVRNVGSIPALDVRVFDRVPDGCELIETVPSAEPISDILAWQLGDLQPGEERSLILKLVPQTEGEIGSVARVVFESASSVRTVATRPDLKLVQRAPEQVLIGQQLEIDLELSNVGSGAAQNVLLKVDLPDGLDHVNGKQIESPIGLMSPGDKRRQLLRLRATRPGLISNTIWLVDADGVKVPSTVEIEVIAPNVELALDGPSLRYLERQATYQVQIGNAGTADATNVEIAAFLDKGLKFVSTESAGQYDAGRHAVFWSLEELPAGQAGTVALTLLPVEPGAQEVRLEAHGDLGITATSEKELTIQTLAELNFTITDDQDPIETGAVATYVVRVQNSGTRDDTNVRLEIQLPHPAIELVGLTPAAQTDGLGRIVFEPIARIPAKGEQVYKIQVKGNLPDTHLIKATLMSDQSKKPVTKEESTTVYSDK